MIANTLLSWLSAKGSGTWTRFRAALEELQESEEIDDASGNTDTEDPNRGDFPIYHQFRQTFERLGHAEFFRHDFPNGWRVVPPTLVSVSDRSKAIGFLCGARTDELISEVSGFSAELQVERTRQSNCPDRIQIVGGNQEVLRQLAESTGLYFQQNASLMLLTALPTVDDYQLRRPIELPFGSDWDVSRYSASDLSWKAVTVQNARNSRFGLFRVNVRFRRQYYLKLGEESYEVPVQVGKYIILKKARRHVLSYHPKNKLLVMPVSCRPPRLVDRALTLCSGLVPDLESGCLHYQNINREIAIAVSGLLRQ